MKIESKIITERNKFMMRVLGMMMFCIVLQGNVFAIEQGNGRPKGSHCNKQGKCHPGPIGPKGATGLPGNPGPNFGQYACFYTSVIQTVQQNNNVFFETPVSLAGITYNSATGVFTLQPGTYSITYFSGLYNELNLVVNGATVSNSPLDGSATVMTLSNAQNTVALQAQSTFTLLPPQAGQCNVMITIYQIN